MHFFVVPKQACYVKKYGFLRSLSAGFAIPVYSGRISHKRNVRQTVRVEKGKKRKANLLLRTTLIKLEVESG